MAISSSTRKAGPYLGNDATTVFPFDFKVFEAADLMVVETDNLLIERTLELGPDYSVELHPNQDEDAGGSVILAAALPDDYLLTIGSNLPLTQPLELTNAGGFYPRVINAAFDRITIIAQQLLEQLGRTLKLPFSTNFADATLPVPVANGLIGFNSAADGFTVINPMDLVTVAGYADARVQQFDGDGVQTDFVIDFNPGVLANLDISIGGVVQLAGVDFTWSGVTVVFTSPPYDGAVIQIRYARPIAPVPNFDGILTSVEDAEQAATDAEAARDAAILALTNKQDKIWQPTAAAVPRLLSARVGESVSVADYVLGAASVDDNYFDLMQDIAAPGAREFIYPEGLEIELTATALWTGDRTHRFGRNARIVGEVNGYVIRGLGYPDLLDIEVTEAIARGSVSFVTDGAAALSPGDDFFLIDQGTQEYDVNVVRAVVGNTVYTKRPINYAFATPANVQVLALANACRNVKVFGGEIRNLWLGGSPEERLGAHGLNFLNATDILLDGTVLTDTGGIGLAMENSMRWKANNIATIGTGSAGFGNRNVKDFEITGFIGRYPNIDESLVFYKNCTHGGVFYPDIEQYAFGEEPEGNAGTAGCNILLDERCCDITIRDPRLRGSTTFSIFINNGSDRNRVFNPNIALANLSGIAIKNNCHDNYVEGGFITDILSAEDGEFANPAVVATAAIQDDATCTGNVLDNGTRFARLNAATVPVRQLGTPGAVAVRGSLQVRNRGWTMGVNTPSTALSLTPSQNTGKGHVTAVVETDGGFDYGAFAWTSRSLAPNLTRQGEVATFIGGTGELRVAFVDFTNFTVHQPAAPLGAQGVAVPNAAAAPTQAEFNALLTSLRNAKLIATV